MAIKEHILRVVKLGGKIQKKNKNSDMIGFSLGVLDATLLFFSYATLQGLFAVHYAGYKNQGAV